MTTIRRLKSSVTGPNAATLPKFVPGTGVPGVTHRWRAASLTGADGTAIATWTPQTGTSSLANTTAAAQPTLYTENGTKMVRFDGVDDVLTAAAVTEANLKTITIVGRFNPPGTATNQGLIGIGGGSAQYNAGLTPKQVRSFYLGTGANKSLIANTPADGPLFHTISMVGDAAGQVFGLTADTLHASESVPGTAPFQGNKSIELGRYAGTQFGAIDVLEVICWGTALTEAQRLAVRTAMRAAYPNIIT